MATLQIAPERGQLSGMPVGSPKHGVHAKPWFATLRISLYLQALQGRFINQAIEMLQSVLLHGPFFFFPLREKKKKYLHVKNKQTNKNGEKQTYMEKAQMAFSSKDKC